MFAAFRSSAIAIALLCAAGAATSQPVYDGRERPTKSRFCTSGTLAVADGNYLAMQVIAGSLGAWVFVDLQTVRTPTPGQVTVGWRTYPNVAAAPTITAPLTGTLEPPVYPFDGNKPCSTRVLAGETVTNANPTQNLPVYGVRDITVAANGFFHLGGFRMAPAQWIAPGNVFHITDVALSAVGDLHSFYIGVYITEPEH